MPVDPRIKWHGNALQLWRVTGPNGGTFLVVCGGDQHAFDMAVQWARSIDAITPADWSRWIAEANKHGLGRFVTHEPTFKPRVIGYTPPSPDRSQG